MYSKPSHLTCHTSDYYPVSQFQELSRKVKSKSNKHVKHYEQPKISPREEIYKSMLREIKRNNVSNMSSLVHKASGILRLAHYDEVNKNRKATVSWNMSGRRVITYDEKTVSSSDITSTNRQRVGNDIFKNTGEVYVPKPAVQSSLIIDSKRKNPHLEASSDSDVNMSTLKHDAVSRRIETRKLWQDYLSTGDVTKLWESKKNADAVNKLLANSPSSTAGVSKDSLLIESTRPSWKNFSKPSIPNELIKSWEQVGVMWNCSPSSDTSVAVASASLLKPKLNSASRKSFDLLHKNCNEKVDRVQNICVVNGSVVSFKDFGFENFTNWFGDESTLEVNQQRFQPKFHLELDLTDVENKNVKIRILDGYKLEVEARRNLHGTQKFLRMKEILLLPKGYKAEDLLMCRTKTGRLVVENLTQEPMTLASASATQLHKKSTRIKGKSQSNPRVKWRL